MLNVEEWRIMEMIQGVDLTQIEKGRAFLHFCHNVAQRDPENIVHVLPYTKKMKEDCQNQDFRKISNERANQLYELYWGALLFEAPYLFDSYLLYLERNRSPEQAFYAPKRDNLLRMNIIQSLQDLEDGKLKILSISLPPGTGKTTIEKFFCSWVIGRHPEEYNLFFSHSDDITKMFYKGVYDITTDNIEYTWGEIFPGVNLQATDAKAETLNYGKYKPFASLQCTSVGSKNAGKVRASRYLFCDDIIGGIEEALNKNTLEKLWRIYSTDARQRKLNEDVRELHIATRWSVADIIGRLKAIYEEKDYARFIAIPDIDPETGLSNFDYKYKGMSVEFFHDQELAMDEITYRCLYKNEPVEREGLLYREDEIRRYASLPIREPDAVLGVCDTKSTGIDYMFLPVFYQYDDDFYLVDCVCDSSMDFEYQYQKIVNLILRHGMQQCEFESNQGGNRIAHEVQKRVAEAGGVCNITTKYTETNKETRIIVNSDWIKKHVLFRMRESFSPRDDYGRMMNFLLGYSVAGKNKFDDVPDGLANFVLYVGRKMPSRKVIIIESPF